MFDNDRQKLPAYARNAFQRIQDQKFSTLASVLDRWFAGSKDVTIEAYSPARISVADTGFQPFEHDERLLKSHGIPNNIFGDLLGAADIRWSIVVYLSKSNRLGAAVDTFADKTVSVISLGEVYSFADVTAAFSHVLSQQTVKLVRPWFLERMRGVGLDPDDPSFASFVAQ